MAKFNKEVESSSNIDRVPGRWLVEIPAEIQVKKDDAPRPGIETIDPKTGQPRVSKATGIEMWSAAAVVTDTLAGAPTGAKILGINLLWGGKGEAATHNLLRALGHPIDAWKKETDPKKLTAAIAAAAGMKVAPGKEAEPEFLPEHFYGRPFVLDCAINDKGYLEPAGFNPYYPPTARRGPAPEGTGHAAAKGGGAGAGGAGAHAGPGSNGSRRTPASAASAHGDAEESLPF